MDGTPQRDEVADAIAIIGLANKFPSDADDTPKFWDFILRGRSAHVPWPKDRIGEGHYHPDRDHGGSFAVPGAHFLKADPANFDAPFFNITKNEAACMCPQQRVVLENVYHALENAGIPMSKVTGSNTGVFMSGFNHDQLAVLSGDMESALRYRTTGLTNSMLSNRVSWFFDFKGPSMTIETACSSSLVTLHQACQSLRTGETDLAISTGVTIVYHPNDIIAMSHQGFLGQDGKSFSFDHRANGYGRGEGVGTVIVKRLTDAIRDGDTIRAIVRGTAVNQDGRTPGLTLPDSGAQERLIQKVYATAGLDVKDTHMIEAHGTGTAAGDPIEASAIARAFAGRSRKIPMFVGALKSGLGHLEGAAGVASLIKATLILETGIIPPNVNLEKINPKIPATKWNLQFPTEPTPWPTEGLRRMSINSFGVGGTNAHCILDDAFHFMEKHGLHGVHHTKLVVPTKAEINKLLHNDSLSNGALTNGHQTNGTLTNGHHINGALTNGQHTNGTLTNGHETNGALTNGHHTNGSLTNGDHMNGSLTNGTLTNGHETNGILTNGHQTNGIKTNGDTNGHLDNVNQLYPPKLIPLTAFDEQGIARVAQSQVAFLETVHNDSDHEDRLFVKDYAYTLSQRSKFSWRSVALARTTSELIQSLSETLPKPLRARPSLTTGFVFTGQGAQWYAMGRELLCYPIFRDSLDQCSTYLQSLGADWSLIEELSQPKETSRINEVWLAQPACTAIQVALIDLLAAWDIRPSRVVGHSSGEIAAAYCAGLLDTESAWKVAYFRGLVCTKPKRSNGTMMAVGLGYDAVSPYIQSVCSEQQGDLVVACINSPKNTTISGDEHMINALRTLLEPQGIFARKLNVSNAYHSPHMNHLADEYLQLLGNLEAAKSGPSSTCLMVSSVTGSVLETDLLGAEYWVQNLVSPVRFNEALAELCFARFQNKQASLRVDSTSANVFADVLLELGPHGALQSAIRDILASKPEGGSVQSLASLNRTQPGVETLLTAIGQLFSKGYNIDISLVNNSHDLQRKPERAAQLLQNLPGYKFNHSELFWYESRLSRNFRLRKHRRHDLFGAPVADWDSAAPKWRNVLRLSEQPWLQDHIVTNAVIMPGVGYIISAIEAARQLAEGEGTVTGYRLRDIHLKRALMVPNNKDGVEVALTFNPMDEASQAPSAVWRRFQITSYNTSGENWIEHCTGYIAVDFETAYQPVDDGRESREDAAAWSQAWSKATEVCTVPWDFSKTYENLVTIGLKFGPLFQNVRGVSGTSDCSGQVIGTVTVPEVAKAMPKGHASPHLIHPATMDSFIHFALGSVMDALGKSNLDVAMIPRFIKDVWVSAKLDNDPGHVYKAHGESELIAFGKYESHIKIWDGPSSEPRVSIRGIESSPLDSARQGVDDIRKLCHKYDLVPYLETFGPSRLLESAQSPPGYNETELEKISRLQLAVILLVSDALDDLQWTLPAATQGHLEQYFEWMKYLITELEQDKIPFITRADFDKYKDNKLEKAKLYAQIEKESANGVLAVRMGTNIVSVLKGEVDPLNLMFGQDDLLDRVYGDVANLNQLPAQQKAFLNVIAHNNTNLRVLEVGAGVGSSTAHILESLAPSFGDGSDGMCSVSAYTYTDISAAFFDKARERFERYQSIMEYKVLDAERDLVTQGHELGTYDLLIAQNVVHATADLTNTLGNICKLLKPGGRLILQEGVRQDCYWPGIAFGQLSGWWLGVEPIRKWSPWISSEQWDTILHNSGYTGTRFELPDSLNDELHTQSLFVAQTALQNQDAVFPWKEVALLTTSSMPESTNKIVSELSKYFSSVPGVETTTVISLDHLKEADYSRCLVVSLMELERPVVSQLTQVEYEGIQQLLTCCKGLLWVHGDVTQMPEYGAILGLMRTNRWERDLDDVNLVTLSISDPRPSVSQLVQSVGKLCVQQFSESLLREQFHGEYTLEGETVLTSRLYEAPEADGFLQTSFGKLEPVNTLAKDAGRPIKLTVPAPGMLDKLEWITDDIYKADLKDTEVEVRIKAVGLNFRDLMIAMGEHMAYSMGSEAAGVISRVGPKVTDFKPGDRVVWITGLRNVGCMHTYGRLDQSTVVHIPDSLSFEIACSLPVVYTTVIRGLRDAARLEKGEKILIHAAAGGVGQAAINYSQWIGAEIFCTVSSLEKRNLLIKEYGIPEDHIFSSRDLTFVSGIKRVTNGYGVDVVLNSLAGEAFRRSWDLVAPFGRFIEIGKKDAQLNGKVDLRPYLQQVTMASVDLGTMMINRPSLIRQLSHDTMKLWEQGVAKPAIPTTVMPMSQVTEGLRTLQSGKGFGKMVLVPEETDLLPVVPDRPTPYLFRDDASYVLSGGLGGIGRSIARWMTSRNARNLIFLSSSGKITEAVAQMKQDLEAVGCNVHIFKCDVTDKESLRKVLDECKATLPPIKGVIQGAMKLEDGMFENMSYETFQLAVKPKIQGSWNLHELLPSDLDHFVMLSSVTGVFGNRSQANYAAGNTYQDALARHRRAHGLKATSIDVGPILSVGYVAEHRERTTMTKHLDAILEMIREEELLALVEFSLNPESSAPVQLVTGLTTGDNYRRRGVPPPTYMTHPTFTHLSSLHHQGGAGKDGADGEPALETLLNGATTFDAAVALVQTGVIAKLAMLLSLPTDDVSANRSVSAHGVDSLVALEFRAFLMREARADVSVLDIMSALTIAQLSRKIAAASTAVNVEGPKE